MALTSGIKLGPYEIIAPLGAGGMGEVYRARDTRLNRTVAVKVLPTHLSEKAEAKERFAREARAIASLNHPNICQLYDVGSEGAISYLVMEYLEGSTLADRLRKGPLPLEEMLRIAVDVCEGLEKAHRSGVVHRDLKPSNIMLTKDGAKLMDFGLAKPATTDVAAGLAAGSMATMSQPLTAEGVIVGTFQYMSPEQVDGKDTDARSDIFALGAVLYEMITGKRAFAGKTTASTMAAILTSQPEPISSVMPVTPPMLDSVVNTCLAKDPDQRFQSAHDLKLQLKWAAQSVPTLPLKVPRKGERWAWISVVAVLLLGLVLTYSRKAADIPEVSWSQVLPPETASFAYFAGPVSLSHDGRMLAFVATSAEGQDSLWVRSLGEPAALSLAGTEGASYPFWSADDRSIAFFAGGKLKTVGSKGGLVVNICDAPGSRGGTWNENGDILFATTWSAIYRVPSSGGTPVEATKLDASRGETSHRWPNFLPDGKHFLYLAANFTGGGEEVATVHLAALDSSENKPLFHARSNAAYTSGYIFYARDRMLMAQAFDEKTMQIRDLPFPVAGPIQYDELTWRGVFSCSRNGTLAFQGTLAGAQSRMIMFDRTGKQMRVVGTPGDLNSQRISPDGQRLALVSLDSSVANYKLWVFDMFRERTMRLTFGPKRNFSPVWAPDGKSLVFASNDKGPYDIFRIRSDSTGVDEPLLRSSATKYPTDWSVDGRFIAYNSTIPGNSKAGIWILPLSGERKPYIFLQGNFNVGEGHFSPDGHWLAYSSDESGRSEIYVTSFPNGGSKWQISAAGGSSPRWRRDGKEVFYMALDSTLMAAEVEDRGSVFQIGATHPLFRMLLRTGASRQDLSSTSGQIAYDAAPDGRSFVVNSPPEGTPPSLTLVLNWAAGVKK